MMRLAAKIAVVAIFVLESAIAQQCSQNSISGATQCLSTNNFNFSSSDNLCGQINQIGQCFANTSGIVNCVTSLPMVSDYQARIYTCQNIAQLNGWIGFLNQSSDPTFKVISSCMGTLVQAVITNKTNIDVGCIQNVVNLWNQKNTMNKTVACQQLESLILGCLQGPVQAVCSPATGAIVQKLATLEGAPDIIMSVCQGWWPNSSNQTSANATSQMSNGMSQMANGTSQMANGTSQMAVGMLHMVNGTSQMTNGTSQMANGTSQTTKAATTIANDKSSTNSQMVTTTTVMATTTKKGSICRFSVGIIQLFFCFVFFSIHFA